MIIRRIAVIAAAGFAALALGMGAASADVGNGLATSCNAGHGAFGAFSQNPNSVYQGSEAHAPGQGENVGFQDGNDGQGGANAPGTTGSSNSSYAAYCQK